MRREREPDLNFERYEDRLVFANSACLIAVCATAGDEALTDGFQVSEQPFVADDNSTDTARDIGVLVESFGINDGYVGRYDDRDVFRFELETAASISVDLQGLTADADLRLLDADGLTVATSINQGNVAESIREDLGVGEYFVMVESHDILAATNYSLDVAADVNVVPDQAGDTFETAFVIGELPDVNFYEGFVGHSDTADVLRFHIEQSSSLVVSLTNLEADLSLQLFSSDEVELAVSMNAGTADEQLASDIASGTYYIVVKPVGDVSSTYELAILNTPDQPQQPESEPEDPTSSDPTAPLPDVAYVGGSQQWGLNSVRAPEAWNAGYTGEGVVVAIIDSGVQTDHPDLSSNIWVNADEIAGDGIDNDGNGYIDDHLGWDFVDNNANPYDGNGHGTHVAGIVGAQQNDIGSTGIAWSADVMAVRVLDDEGAGTTFDVAEGIRYAVDNGAHIVNLSLGGVFSSSIQSAIAYAAENDVFVVAASGNTGASEPGYPGLHSESYTNIISVGAYNSNHQIASFSNRVGVTAAIQVDAPGVTIYSSLTTSRYGYQSGTSMASPAVAGVAALILSANPDLTAAQLRRALTEGAVNEISGSDSIGGINAAYSIPLAISYTSVNSTAAIVSQSDPEAADQQDSMQTSVANSSGIGASAVLAQLMNVNSAVSDREAADPEPDLSVLPDLNQLDIDAIVSQPLDDEANVLALLSELDLQGLLRTSADAEDRIPLVDLLDLHLLDADMIL